jgi:rhodanese-related sulfurtransferase
MPVVTVPPQEVAALRQEGRKIRLIDVRTPAEYREVHAEGAELMPLDSFDPKAIAALAHGIAEPIYIICKSGSRARQACEKCLGSGVLNVVSVDGGTAAWEQAGLPVIRGKKTMSLERQVRIAAGLLVLIGAGLSFVHPGWIGLSAFVGAGLVFAGVTDTCGMAMVLAKMPWNQASDCGMSCSR